MTKASSRSEKGGGSSGAIQEAKSATTATRERHNPSDADTSRNALNAAQRRCQRKLSGSPADEESCAAPLASRLRGAHAPRPHPLHRYGSHTITHITCASCFQRRWPCLALQHVERQPRPRRLPASRTAPRSAPAKAGVQAARLRSPPLRAPK